MTDRWERLAARWGGTVSTLHSALDADGAPIMFASTPVGLHYSTDLGHTWATTTLGTFGPTVQAAAVSPGFARDRTLFVGTEDSLFRSRDAGATWRPVLTGSRMLAIATSPFFEDDHVLFVGTDTDGILRSEDAGDRWVGANAGVLDLMVLALALSPRFDVDRTAFVATGSGLYRSRNGGKSWRAVALPVDEPAVQCLALSPAFGDDRLVLAGTEAHGLLRSRDAGTTWEVVPELAERGITTLAFSAANPARIAAGTAEGIALSADAGETWSTEPVPGGPALCLEFAWEEGASESLLAGLPGLGVVRRAAEGADWTPSSEGLEGSLLTTVACSPAFALDRTLFLAGLEDGVSVSTDGGATWATGSAGPAPATAFDLAVSPHFRQDRTVFATCVDGLYRSRDAGASWERLRPAATRAVRATTRPDGGGLVVVAALRDAPVLVSEDGGDTWHERAGPPGPAEALALALAPDFARGGGLWLGTRSPDGEVVLWRSGDDSWQRVFERRGLATLPVAVATGPAREQTIFVGAEERVLRPLRQAQAVVGGERRPIWRGDPLPDEPGLVTALRPSPAFERDGVLVAGTSTGVYLSRDAGATFVRWCEGLASGPTVALTFADEGEVIALQLGGSLWRRRLG
jgi:photosystem II stability/assembly factor-like uncharacterized protein